MDMIERVFLLFWTLTCPILAQVLFEKPLSPRIANYDLKAVLLPDAKAIDGSWTLHWRNRSETPVTELQFHLYLNAFKNEKSTFLTESGGRHRAGTYEKGEINWGYVDIRRINIVGGEDLTDKIEYIHPDDDNADDQTVIRIPLSKPVEPGTEIELSCDFYSKLPRAYARTGFGDDDFYFIGQWFPKIGVWQNNNWNCHQFHSNSEFFADFGVYTMELTVPKRFVVGANAVLQNKTSTDSTDTYFYRQEDVIDAVWTAYPDYTEIKQEVNIRGTNHKIEVTYLLAPDREALKERYFLAVDSMFNYYQEWFGSYPYSNLTIVDPPVGSEMTVGGMEYPTLITTGGFFSSKMATELLGLNWLEVVTFHEFAHNYFQSLVATNEFEEPWLDEGFTSYAEHRALERFCGETTGYGNVLGMPFSSLDYHRMSYIPNPRGGTMPTKAWEIPTNFYQTAAYSKPVLVLTTLERLLGTTMMNQVMRTYFENWHFGHPRTEDFIAVVNQVAGRDLSWFFNQYVYGDQTIDLHAGSIINTNFIPDEGWFGDGSEMQFSGGNKEEGSDSTIYRAKVRVYNDGTGTFPTDIVIHFANGDSTVKQWDGSSGLIVYEFHNTPKVTSVAIDPLRKNLLDLNFSNNTRNVEAQSAGISRYTLRFLFWLEYVLQFVMSLF